MFLLTSFFCFWIQFRIPHFIYLSCLFGLLQSVTVSQPLAFMTLTTLKDSGQLLCRVSLIWIYLIFFHGLIEIVQFEQEYHRSKVVSFSMCHVSRYIMCPITGDDNLDRLVKVVSAVFYYSEITIFLFAINTY